MAGKRPVSQSSEYPPPKRAFTEGSTGFRPTTDPRREVRSPASSTASRSSAVASLPLPPAPAAIAPRGRNAGLSQPQALLYDLLGVSADLTIAEHQHNLLADRHSQLRLELDKTRQRAQFSSAVELQDRAFTKLDRELQVSLTKVNTLRTAIEAKCDQFTTTFLQPSKAIDEDELEKRLLAKFDGVVSSRLAQSKINEAALEAKLMAKLDEVANSRMTKTMSELEHKHQEQIKAHQKIIAERASEITELRGLIDTMQNHAKDFRDKTETDQKVSREALQKVQSDFEEFKIDTLPRMVRFEAYTEVGPELPETSPNANLRQELESLRTGLEDCQENIKHAKEAGPKLPESTSDSNLPQEIESIRTGLDECQKNVQHANDVAKNAYGALDLLTNSQDGGLIARVNAIEDLLSIDEANPGTSPRLDDMSRTVQDLSENRVKALESDVSDFGPKIDSIEKLDKQVGEEIERIDGALEQISGQALDDWTAHDPASLRQLKSMIDDLTSQLANPKSQASNPAQAEPDETASLSQLKSMMDNLTSQLTDVKSQTINPPQPENTGEIVAKQEIEDLKTKGDQHRRETEALKRIIQIVQDKVNVTTTEHITENFACWFREQGINHVRTGIPELAHLAQMAPLQATIHQQVTQITTFQDRLTDLRALIERDDRGSQDEGIQNSRNSTNDGWLEAYNELSARVGNDMQDAKTDRLKSNEWQRTVDASIQQLNTTWPQSMKANITTTLQELQAHVKQQHTNYLSVTDANAKLRRYLDELKEKSPEQTDVATELEKLSKSQADLSKRFEIYDGNITTKEIAMRNDIERISKSQTELSKRLEHPVTDPKQTDLRVLLEQISSSQTKLSLRVENYVANSKQTDTRKQLEEMNKSYEGLSKRVEDHIDDTVAVNETRDKDIGDLQAKVLSMSTIKQGLENLGKLTGRVDSNDTRCKVLESAHQEELVARTQMQKALEEGGKRLTSLQEGLDVEVLGALSVKQDVENLKKLAARMDTSETRCGALESSRREELIARTQMQQNLLEDRTRLDTFQEGLDAVPGRLAAELKSRDKIREEERQKIDVAFVGLTKRLEGLDIRRFGELDIERLEGLETALEIQSATASECRSRVEALANLITQPQVPSGPTTQRFDAAERRLVDLEERCSDTEAWGTKYEELRGMLTKRAQRSSSVTSQQSPAPAASGPPTEPTEAPAPTSQQPGYSIRGRASMGPLAAPDLAHLATNTSRADSQQNETSPLLKKPNGKQNGTPPQSLGSPTTDLARQLDVDEPSRPSSSQSTTTTFLHKPKPRKEFIPLVTVSSGRAPTSKQVRESTPASTASASSAAAAFATTASSTKKSSKQAKSVKSAAQDNAIVLSDDEDERKQSKQARRKENRKARERAAAGVAEVKEMIVKQATPEI